MKSILASFIIIAAITSLTEAEISLKLDGYNSEDFMSMDLVGQNLNYGGLLYLEPQTMMYKNGGSSNDPNGFYSFNIRYNEDSFHSGASTESGGFSWTAEIKPSWNDVSYVYPNEFFRLDSYHFVKDGILKSSFGNENVNVEEYIKTFDASYSESIGINVAGVQSKGSGSTAPMDISFPQNPESEILEPDLSEGFISMSDKYVHAERGPSIDTVSTQEVDRSYIDSPTASPNAAENDQIQDGRGFSHQIRVDGINDWGRIKAEILGDTSSSWKCGVDAQGSDMAFGMNVEGISKDAMQKLQMEAEGSDIPLQFLPPGDVEIDYKTATELELEQYQQFVSLEKDAFYTKYPSLETSNEPSTWYYIKQNVYMESSEEDNSPNTEEDETGTPELFEMMMGFYIKDNK
jgi:hypothetical protein